MTYQELCQFEVLYRGYLSARSGKRKKRATAEFEADVLENILEISAELGEKTYRPGEFELFKVYEPKERLVQAPAFRDKVVLHAITDNILYDAITRSFIRDNCASQKGKGTFDALLRLKYQMGRYYRRYGVNGWVLKGDVRHFFASIPHGPLKVKLKEVCVKRGVDAGVYDLLCVYIDSSPDGLPLGYQTSQLLALLFLDDFDHFVKERLGAEFYGRYMDDFYVLCPDKKRLRQMLAAAREWMGAAGLELNEKTAIFPIRHGVNFLGFHTYLTESGKAVQKLRRANRKRMSGRIRRWRYELAEGSISKEQVKARWRAWDAFAAHGDTYALRAKIAEEAGKLIGEELEPCRKIRSTKKIADMRRVRQYERWQRKHTEGQAALPAPRPDGILPWEDIEDIIQ